MSFDTGRGCRECRGSVEIWCRSVEPGLSDNYVTDSESEVGSWALLVGAASRPKKRPRAPLRALEVNQAPARGVPAAETMLQLMPPTMDVTALQPEQRRALMAQLAAMDVMEG